MKTGLVALTVSLQFFLLLTAVNSGFVHADPPTIVVPDDFSTIQEAVNNANLGDVVFVRTGVYVERVVVNKTISLIGESSKTTIVDGNKAGPVILVAANGVNLTGFTIRAGQNTHPICNVWLENVSQCSVHGNILTYAFYGVYLNEANGNSVYENSAMNGSIGICGFHSDGNSVFSNVFTANSFAGINFHFCSYNSLAENLISDNSRGARLLDGANNNTIYHNSFINNTGQIYVQSSYNNTWDDGYPSGGNYWSDYDGADADHDGIGDAAYVIDAYNMDHYPLIESYVNIMGDINGDGKVDMKDVGYVARRFMCVPADPLWDSSADVNGDGKINMLDIGTVARHFGEHYP